MSRPVGMEENWSDPTTDARVKPKAIIIEPYADDVPLNGAGRPEVDRIDDLLRMLATIRHRWGNTVITFSGTWGSNALWAQDSLSEENATLKKQVAELERELAGLKRVGAIDGDQIPVTQAAFNAEMRRADVLATRNAALKAEVESLRQDAERYRWLRLHPVWQRQVIADRGWFDSDADYDTAIDAARAKTDDGPITRE